MATPGKADGLLGTIGRILNTGSGGLVGAIADSSVQGPNGPQLSISRLLDVGGVRSDASKLKELQQQTLELRLADLVSGKTQRDKAQAASTAADSVLQGFGFKPEVLSGITPQRKFEIITQFRSQQTASRNRIAAVQARSKGPDTVGKRQREQSVRSQRREIAGRFARTGIKGATTEQPVLDDKGNPVLDFTGNPITTKALPTPEQQQKIEADSIRRARQLVPDVTKGGPVKVQAKASTPIRLASEVLLSAIKLQDSGDIALETAQGVLGDSFIEKILADAKVDISTPEKIDAAKDEIIRLLLELQGK